MDAPDPSVQYFAVRSLLMVYFPVNKYTALKLSDQRTPRHAHIDRHSCSLNAVTARMQLRGQKLAAVRLHARIRASGFAAMLF